MYFIRYKVLAFIKIVLEKFGMYLFKIFLYFLLTSEIPGQMSAGSCLMKTDQEDNEKHCQVGMPVHETMPEKCNDT